MSADSIVYCLENLTDYFQFERLCSDVMNQSGYKEIEPLGGSNDRGRDALHSTHAQPNEATIFAYSVRGDWRQKLINEDCQRIRSEQHKISHLVFVTTASITATQKDAVKQAIKDEFGWVLQIFDLERLRIRLAGDLRYLVAQHPAIFCEPFFPTRGGLSIAESRDTLVIDHHSGDHAVATWLSRRLQLAGFRIWCYGTAPLAGEDPDESVRTLIRQRAVRYLPILSTRSVTDSNFITRCGIATETDGLVLPCVAEEYQSEVPRKLADLAASDFSKSWAAGLASVIASLNATGVSQTFDGDQGKAIALRSYVPEPVTKQVPETVYSNAFPVTVPNAVHVYRLHRAPSKEQKKVLREEWAFVLADANTLLSFEPPPVAMLPSDSFDQPASFLWEHCEFEYGKRSRSVVKELIWRSLDVACGRAGLLWCDDRRKFFFAQGSNPRHKLSYVHVDGRKTHVSATGQKTLGSGEHAQPFRYQLCPTFKVGQDEPGAWWATMKIYIRITDLQGQPHQKKAITRRRKQVANGWWNKHWFARTIAIMQALANENLEIVIGVGKQQVIVSASALQWQCPVAIDYDAVERIGDFQAEMAALRYREIEQDEERRVNLGGSND